MDGYSTVHKRQAQPTLEARQPVHLHKRVQQRSICAVCAATAGGLTKATGRSVHRLPRRHSRGRLRAAATATAPASNTSAAFTRRRHHAARWQ